LTKRSIALNPRADFDIKNALSHYQVQKSFQTGEAFLTELGRCLEFVKTFPKAGSLRLGHEVGRRDIRTWPMNKFPFLLLYKETRNKVDVLRVIHQRSDIPRWVKD
jgi:toxin ParE1/3/4